MFENHENDFKLEKKMDMWNEEVAREYQKDFIENDLVKVKEFMFPIDLVDCGNGEHK